GCVAERRHRERQQHHEPARAQGRTLGEDFDRDAPPPGYVEPIHESGEALVVFPRPGARAEHRRIDARIEVEQEALQLGLPVAGKKIAQSPNLSLAYSWSMILSENRYPPRIKVRGKLFRDYAPGAVRRCF